MKKYVISAVLIIVALAFVSCDGYAPQYWHSEYFWGTVTDAEGNGIPGIQVQSSGRIYDTSVERNGECIVRVTYRHYMPDPYKDTQGIPFLFVDVDGEQNGGCFETVEYIHHYSNNIQRISIVMHRVALD